MRILQIVFSFHPTNTYGGSMAVARDLSMELVRRGNEVTVFTSDFEGRTSRVATKEQNIQGIHVVSFRNLSRRLAWDYRLFIMPDLVRRLKKDIQHYDIVHCHDHYNMQNVAVQYYGKKFGVPYVVQSHGSAMTYFHRGPAKRLFDLYAGRRVLSDATRVLALTEREAHNYEIMGVQRSRIRIVYNGIDMKELGDRPEVGFLHRKLAMKTDERIIFYLGRIHQMKGLDMLVHAFDGVSQTIGNLRLVIAGPDDGFLHSLTRMVADLGLDDRVSFLGPIYGREKIEAFMDSEVFVLPSHYETFPMTVLEAWACRKPVIVTKQCGIANMVRDAGIVVDADGDAIEVALSRILSDEHLRTQMGMTGYSIVQNNLRLQVVAEQIERLYEDCIAERK